MAEDISGLQLIAKELQRQGRFGQAAAVHEQILKLDQNAAPSLNYLGMMALRKGDAERSAQLFRRAITSEPDNAGAYRNLALALQQLQRHEEAIGVFRDAIERHPQDALAHLYAGAAFAQIGWNDAAAAAYWLALELDPSLQALEREEKAPPALRELSRRANAMRNAKFAECFEQAVEDCRERYDRASLQRFEEMVFVQLKRREAHYLSPRQKPFESYLQLPPQPWFERAEFDWVAEVEAAYRTLAEELAALNSEQADLRPYVHTDTGEAHWRELLGSLNWSSLHLFAQGRKRESVCARYARTSELMERLPLIHLAGRCPEVFFSILKPGTHLPPHYGQANYKLTAHLPIVVPGGCAITVGGETRQWTPGEMLIFDDTFLHEAWNNSDSLRIVLIFEVWNPLTTEIERAAIRSIYDLLQRWMQQRRALMLGRE